MKVLEKVGDKLFNIHGVVDKKINERLENIYSVNPIGKEIQTDALFNYRQCENKVWASDSANKLLEFYKTNYLPAPYNAERYLFWNWVNGVKTPMLHYSTPQRIINQMKSLLFSQELDINVVSGNKQRDKELNDKLHSILDEVGLYELLQKSVNYETYSGTLGWKFIMDTDVSPAPIIEPYPAENMVFKARHKKAQEVIYIDEYISNNKRYYLKSRYGKGYIIYELWNDRFKKQVSLNIVEELKDYKNIVILGRDGKPIDIMLTTFKKNREVNSEFPDSLYGGSDFQGIIDSFQLIDELYSQKQLVVRRSRPLLKILEEQLPYNNATGKVEIPPEYRYDILPLKRANDVKEDGVIKRDVPLLQTEQYDKAIQEELKSIFATIGMAYTTVGLEAHSANISGVALETKEKSTVIIRNNKIRLWKKFLKDSLRLMMIYDSLKTAQVSVGEDGVTYIIDNDFDYEFQVEFPNYYDLSREEKVLAVKEMINLGLIDRKTAFTMVFGREYEEDESTEIILNAKLENGVPLLSTEVQQTNIEPPLLE